MRKIKTNFFLMIFVLAGAGAGFAEKGPSKLSFSISGGWGTYDGADYNSAAGDANINRAWTGVGPDTLDKFTTGCGAGLEAVYWIAPRWGIGAGLGWFGSRITDNRLDSRTSLYDSTMVINASIDIIPVILQLHYLLPLGEKTFIDIGFGPGLYFGRFHSESVSHDNLSSEGYWQSFEFTGRTTALGLQGGIGLEWPLIDNRLWIVGKVEARTLDLHELKDEYLNTWSSTQGTYTSGGTGYKYWAFDRDYGLGPFHETLFLKETPSGSLIQNLKEASVGGSAIWASFGIKVRV